MKKILKIARLELNVLFYSPIAWLVLIIFIIQCGITFTDMLYAKETNQQMGYPIEALTMQLFAGKYGFFTAVQKNLYLYIPLLTMGLMSREISSGSIKLLLSSPLKNSQIILGKFLAMMAYGGLLMLVLLGIMVSCMISVEALDIQYILGGILGLYLLICAYAAIGLFMSSLTSYQVVAAISTLAIFAALNFVSSIGQSVDFVRDITYWLSIAGRADNFIDGLISSKDVVYFLMVICLFLILSVMKLNAGREIRSKAANILRYSAVVCITILIGVLTSLPHLTVYYDTTRFNTNTLTSKSQDLIKQLKKPVIITTYPNVISRGFLNVGAPKMRNFELNQFEKYTRYLPGIKFKYVPYYDTVMVNKDTIKTLEAQARQSAIANGYDFDKLLSPEEIKKEIDLVPEENSFTRTISYDGKRTFLRMFYDMLYYPQEAEISAAIKRLLVKAPVVGVLASNDERSIDKLGDKAYKDATNTLNKRDALINQGFDVVPIQWSMAPIPDDLTVLIIADPKTPYTSEELQKITDYIQKGGNVLVSGEPGRQTELNKIIKPFGVEFMPGMLLQESKDLSPDLMQTHFTPAAKALGFDYPKKTIISMPGTVGLQYKNVEGFQYTPLLITDKKQAWNKLGEFDVKADKVSFNPLTDQRTEAPVALAITRKLPAKEQKIMIVGDADFMSNAELGRYNVITRNADFAINIFKWFSNGEFPIDATRPKPIDNHINVSREEISWLKIIFLGILPASLALAGAYTLIRRKRK